MRKGICALLATEEGIEVVGEAADGQRAIEEVGRLRPDVVLMDINMPDIDGVTAAETITREVPQTQLIMMSVQSDADYRDIDAVADRILSEPHERGVL